MTILIHEYHDLEERASRHLKKWKVIHTGLYIIAAIFGILNYIFLQNSMELIDKNCILFPRDLEFHMVEISNFINPLEDNTNKTDDPDVLKQKDNQETVESVTELEKDETSHEELRRAKRNLVLTNGTTSEIIEIVTNDNASVIVGNKTHRLMLDTNRSLFGVEGCEFTEYMPLMTTVFALVWTVLFIMCPGGGRSRTGLTHPWRILVPALLFSLVMVGLTGHNFTTTSRGITAFCQEFKNLTTDGSCDSVSIFLERGWNASLGFGGRTDAVRAASTALWVTWAAAAAVLLTRCLSGPDFVVKRTHVLIKDPAKKLMPYLVPLSSARSSGRSTNMKDSMSVRSDPTTVTTELVTATVEIPPDSSLTPESDKAFEISEDIEIAESRQDK